MEPGPEANPRIHTRRPADDYSVRIQPVQVPTNQTVRSDPIVVGNNFQHKNFRMCSETVCSLLVLLIWLFPCPHHFAGVWDSWGDSETKLLENVERDGHDTIHTVIDSVLQLSPLRIVPMDYKIILNVKNSSLYEISAMLQSINFT